jgi:transposase
MKATAGPPPPIEANMDEVRDILKHARQLGLPDKEYELLEAIAESYAFLLSEIGDKDATIRRLRQMIFGAKTEKTNHVVGKDRCATGESTAPQTQAKDKPKGHGRLKAEDYVGAEKVKVPHESLHHGDPCPHCRGKLYGKEPRRLVRIRGSAPFVGTVYEQESLRCNLCGEVFTAKAPEGVSEEKFDETVASMVAMLRYGSGLPMHRIEKLQQVLGVPLPASVQWELASNAAGNLGCVLEEHIRQAAQGEIFYNDDTPMKILEFLVEQRKRRERGEEPEERTGTFTSGVVSEVSGRQIVLYFTGRRHAGENLAEVLARRAAGSDAPIQMCDGLDRNLPGELKTIVSNCLVHGRRQFVDVAENFPAEVRHVLEELAVVYRNDARARTEAMSPEGRLVFHQEQSGPVINRLKAWLDALVADKKVEPNSGLGKAITYVQKRWERLTLFLNTAGAPLDNNLCERMLKKAILHRKNSLFYKTQNGARVGDLFMSLIATAKLAKADPFDYLTQLQRHAKQVAAKPSEWMPWNYREALAPPQRPP